MKYVLSFLLGALFTSIFFVYYLKNRLVNTENTTTPTEQEIVQEDASPGLPAGFRKFYEKFHRDSVFQLNHIRFPLEGIPERQGEELNLTDFYWKKEGWILHRPFNAMDGSFIRDFQPIGEGMVMEQIRHSKANYAMLRRFAHDGDDWYLIYYAAMNELAKPAEAE